MWNVEPEKSYVAQIVVGLNVNDRAIDLETRATFGKISTPLCKGHDEPDSLRVQRVKVPAKDSATERVLNQLWMQSYTVKVFQSRIVSGECILQVAEGPEVFVEMFCQLNRQLGDAVEVKRMIDVRRLLQSGNASLHAVTILLRLRLIGGRVCLRPIKHCVAQLN